MQSKKLFPVIAGLLALLITLSTTSCSMMHKFADKNKRHVDSTTHVVENNSRVTHETNYLDTTFKIPYISIENGIAPSDTCGNDTLVTKVTEKDGLKLTQQYNKKTGEYHAKAERDSTALHALVKNEKTTIEQNSKETNSDVKKDEKIVHREKTRKTLIPWWVLPVVFIIAIIVVACIIGYRYLRAQYFPKHKTENNDQTS